MKKALALCKHARVRAYFMNSRMASIIASQMCTKKGHLVTLATIAHGDGIDLLWHHLLREKLCALCFLCSEEMHCQSLVVAVYSVVSTSFVRRKEGILTFCEVSKLKLSTE